MEFRILGPVEVRVDGEVVPIPAPRQRALLALLLVHVNEVLSSDRILEELWRDDLPASGANALRFHVSKLRSAMGVDPSPIVTHGSGYVLAVDPESVDGYRFEQVLNGALDAMGDDPDDAVALIGEALSLWRGDPYSGLGDPGFADGEVRRLNELRMQAVEVGFAANLAMGRHAEIVGGLESSLVEFPFRERLWAHLMVALHRSGRQADALRAYRRASDALGEELGIGPSEMLRELENQILLQDPGLAYRPESPTYLPSPASSFVGRENERAKLVELCQRDRMVTLTGMGGIGKTRLAIEVARDCGAMFDDGGLLIDLVDVADADTIPHRFLAALKIGERPGQSAVEVLQDALSSSRCLLVVDNCEHVVDGVADALSAVLSACSGVHVLATSRVRLGVDGEEVWELDGLGTGDDGDAVRLFVDRARLVNRNFAITPDNEESIVEICEVLDGVPLAIELAAGRARTMSPDEILGRMADRFEFLVDTRRAAPERHRTLVSMIDWSYNLLSESDQRLFRLLGVFVGGFDIEALASMCGYPMAEVTDALERLVDASLVGANTSGSTARYRLLGTVRTYAVGLLETSGEVGDARDRHLTYFAAMGREAFQHQMGPFRLGQPEREEVVRWLHTIEVDVANLRSALEWALEVGDLDAAHEIVVPLNRYWLREARESEIAAATAAVLDAGDYRPTPQRCALLSDRVVNLVDVGDLEEAEASIDALEEASSHLSQRYEHAGATAVSWTRSLIAESRGDIINARVHMESAARHANEDEVPWAGAMYFNAGWLSLLLGDIESASAVAHLLAQDPRNPTYRSLCMHARIAAYRDDHEEAIHLTQEALAHPTERYVVGVIRQSIASAHLNLGDLDEARRIGEAIESIQRNSSARWYRDRTRIHLGIVALRSGDTSQAAALLNGVVADALKVGDRYFLWMAFHAAAEWLQRTGDPETAAVLLGHCAALTEQHRYDPAALDAIPFVTLDSLGERLDPKQIDTLIAQGASTLTSELAASVLRRLVD